MPIDLKKARELVRQGVPPSIALRRATRPAAAPVLATDDARSPESGDLLYRQLASRYGRPRADYDPAFRQPPPPASLDFTVYRSADEPAGVPLPNEVRQAIEDEDRAWIRVYDRPVVRPVYGCDPPPENAFFVHCNRYAGPGLYVGGGRVMVFSPTGEKLHDGSDGGE